MDYSKYDKKETNINFSSESERAVLDHYSKILEKPNKIRVIPSHPETNIPFKSIQKITAMAGIPEEGILKFSGLDVKKEKELQEKKKKKAPKKRIIFNFQKEILEELSNEGCCMAKMISTGIILLRAFYWILLVLALAIFVFFCVHIKKDAWTVDRGEFITICLCGFCCFIGSMGIAKLSKNSKLSFDKLNSALILLILNCGFFFSMIYVPLLTGPNMEKYCQNNKLFIIIITLITLIDSILALAFNYYLEDFYINYFKKADQFILVDDTELVDIK